MSGAEGHETLNAAKRPPRKHRLSMPTRRKAAARTLFQRPALMFAVKNSDAGSRFRLCGTQTKSKQARTAGGRD